MDYQVCFDAVPDWKQRPIWICGLDVVSLGVIRFLERNGNPARGILDEGFSVPVRIAGNDIWPVDHLTEVPKDALFVITAFREKQQRRLEERITARFGPEAVLTMSNPTEIRIEASGKCNLRCPSCQVSNHGDPEFEYEGRGFLNPARMEEILCKIDREIPQTPAIYLFSLGEPLLNPHLPELIRLVHAHGYLAVVSSNLSLRADLEELVESEPDILKISVSGFSQEVYRTTHAGGNVGLVKENMQRLAELIREHDRRILVTTGYHVYNNNDGTELENMKRFSEELGFLFQPVKAMYFNMLKRSGYYPFSENDRRFIESYYDQPETILSCPKPETGDTAVCRNMRDKLFLDYDGTVMLCELFHHEGRFRNYLDVSPDEIRTWRQEHWICRRCMAYGMHLKA